MREKMQEIQAAIEQLPTSQVNELARWIEVLRERREREWRPPSPEKVQEYLNRAIGAGRPGVTTDDIMRMTRGEEYDHSEKPILQRLIELGSTVPDAEWAKQPTDLAKNLDRYLDES